MREKTKSKNAARVWGHSDVRESLGHVGDITWFRTNQPGSKDGSDTPPPHLLLPLQQGEDFLGVEGHVGHPQVLSTLSKSLTGCHTS